MVEPITVWMVHLRRGVEPKETKGTLSMEADALVFVDRQTEATTRIPFGFARKAHRLRGSPVLMVEWHTDAERRRTAFYFAEPPPIAGTVGAASGRQATSGAIDRPGLSFSQLRGPSKRRERKTNIGYLTSRAGDLKETIDPWVAEIRSRLRPGAP